MFEIGLIIGFCIMTIVAITLGIIIRGMTHFRSDEITNADPKQLTGREIESIRLNLVAVGRQDLTYTGALSLVKTIQDIQLGIYEDMDPFVPSDPYIDIV